MNTDDIDTDEYTDHDSDYPVMFLSYKDSLGQYLSIPRAEVMLKYITFTFPNSEHRSLLLDTWRMYERLAHYFKNVCGDDSYAGNIYHKNMMANAVTVYGAWTYLHEIASHNNWRTQ